MMNLYVVLYIVFLNLIPTTICRGPHHPRGQPIAHQHSHYRPKRSDDVTNDNNGHHTVSTKITQDHQLLHDKEHIREDLEEINNINDHNDNSFDLESMSDEELEFHYFQLHDFDNNTKLDGLEILQAIQHTAHHENSNHSTDENVEENVSENDLDYFIELIDRVLAEDDMNHDGYLSYPEYVIGRMKEGQENQIKYSAKPNS